MLKTFHFKKTALVVATSATFLGMHLNSTAQDATLVINGTINATTCFLWAGTQQGGSQTMNLGTFATNAISNVGSGSLFGTAQNLVFRLTADAAGTGNCNTTRWDLGLDVSNLNIVTNANNGRTFITSQAVSGVTLANAVGVTLSTSVGGSTITNGTTPLNLNNQTQFGVLLSNSASGALAAERIALTAQLGRATASAITPGSFSATLPLQIVYR